MVGRFLRRACWQKSLGLYLETGEFSLTRFESNLRLPVDVGFLLRRFLASLSESMPGQARKEGVRVVRASRNIVAGIFCKCLLLTFLALPTPVLSQSGTPTVWLANVTGDVVEGDSISFTVNRLTALAAALDVVVEIEPKSPIEGFNIISNADTNGREVTVRIPGSETSQSFSFTTINDDIVNADVEVTVLIVARRRRYKAHPDSVNFVSRFDAVVRNGDDAYVLGVRLPDPKHVSDTFTEGETITLQFMRCVGSASTEEIKSCDDVVTQRAGAIAPPALTHASIHTTVGGGDVVSGILPNSVAFEAGSFSKTVEIETDDDSIDEYDGSLIIRTFADATRVNRYVSVTIRDNDLAKIAIAPVSASVTEGTDAVFKITRSNTEALREDSFGVALTFHAKMFETTTLPSTRNNLTFAEDATEFRLAIPTHDDELNEGDGMVRADLSGVGNYQTVTGSTWVRIVDDDVPTVTLSATKTSIVEGEPFEWHLTRSDYISEILFLATEREYVRYYPEHLFPDRVIHVIKATPELHFVGVIKAGEMTTVIEAAGGGDYIGPDQDVVGPQGGYIKRRILPFPADSFTGIPMATDVTFKKRYTPANSDFIRVDIANRGPGIDIESQQDSVTEGGNLNFTISRYGGSSSANNTAFRVKINVEQTGDYLAASELGERTVAMPASQSTVSLQLASLDDRLDEEDGTVTVTILPGAASDAAEDTYSFETLYSDLAKRYSYKSSVAVLNDDHRGVTVSTAVLGIDEGRSGTYTIVLDLQPTGQVTVTPSRSSGDADVTVSGALTFTTANWDTAQTVTVSSAQDLDAVDDTAVIGHAVSGADYGSETAESVTVNVDDDDTPRVTLSLSDDSIAEDDGSTTVTASLDYASGVATTVTVSVSPDSPAVAGDYEISANKVLTIAAGQTASTGAVTVTGVDNDVDTADKTVQVKGTAGNTVGTAGPSDVALTLEDDDTRGVTVSKTELEIDEGDDGTYTVVLDSKPTGQVTVTPSRSSGDADVTVSGALTFTTANWDTAQTVTVSSAQDLDAVDDTAVIGHAVSGGDYGSVIAASVAVTADDDETVSSGVTLSVSPESVSEGASATTVTVTASLNGGTRGEATPVSVTAGSGTATSGTDFAAVAGFMISIPANTQSRTGTFTLTPTQDTVDEPDETVKVDGTTTVSGFAVTGTTVGITDDDASPTVTLSLSDTSISEDGGVTTVTAGLSHASSVATTVTVSVSPDSPAVAGDYEISANKVLTIAAGQTASTGAVTVTGVDNDVDTADKTVQVKGTAGNTVGTAGPSDVALTLEDDDTRGVTVSKTELEIDEGDDGTYTVVLDSKPTGQVTVTPSRSSGDRM